jgi:cell division protein FtsB
MALTKEDLQAIRDMMKEELEPMKASITKLESDVSDLKQGQANLEQGQASMKADIADLKLGQQVIRESQLNVETVWLPKIGAAIDGFFSNRDNRNELEDRVVFLEKKADIHDTRLFALERDIKAE